MICFGEVPAGSVLPVMFTTYGGTNGESITLTGLAVTDIEIYKGTSMTQRASDAGYTLLDTDGIDIDTITGLHGFSIDTGDNTDAGFYAAGSFYTVVVSAVTVDAQTVNFIAATFRLRAAETSAGVPKVDISHFGGVANNATGGLSTNIIRGGTAQAGAAGSITLDASASATDDLYNGSLIHIVSGTGAGQSRIISDYVGSTKVASVGSNWATNPSSDSVFIINPLPGVIAANTPANFSSLSVDANGRVDVIKVAGTTQTARDLGASVLLSSGTGTGQLDFTSGVVKASLTQILGTAITGTAAQLAAAFTKFFNVATPTGTANSLPDAVPGASGGLPTTDANNAVKVQSGTGANQIDLTSGKVNVGKINDDATSAANLAKTTRAIGRGTATTGGTTTSIPTSAFVPGAAGTEADQFKGRIITFDADTTTVALRGQSSDITANTSGATPTFTVTAMTEAPASGDTFSVT